MCHIFVINNVKILTKIHSILLNSLTAFLSILYYYYVSNNILISVINFVHEAFSRKLYASEWLLFKNELLLLRRMAETLDPVNK